MQWDRDPATGDYVVENGKPVNTERLTVPAYIRLKTRRDGWMYAPSSELGSEIATVQKLTTTTQSTLLENLCEQALAPMVNDGRASSVLAETIDGRRGARLLNITIIDRQNEEQSFEFAAIGG